MIGFFDSGFGGLTILKEVEKLLPDYAFIYLGDNARAPYGSRQQAEIYRFTVEGVTKLFELGAELVVLACNTASAEALSKLQQEFLPEHFPGKRVLGIIRPTAEEAGSFTKTGSIGILSTEATASSKAYDREIKKVDPLIEVHGQVCPELVPAIESSDCFNDNFSLTIQQYLSELLAKSNKIDAVILGCTHYALINDQIRQLLPENIKLITQSELVALKLKAYLDRHPEFAGRLERVASRIFLTTKNSADVEALAAIFYGRKINFKTVSY